MEEPLYFNTIKLLVVIISIPLLLIKKQWLYYLLAINIAVAAIHAYARRFWMNALMGTVLAFAAFMYLPRNLSVVTCLLYVFAYLLWNIYFTERVIDTDGHHHGTLTSIAMNVVPFMVFIMFLIAQRDVFTCIWSFALIRLVIILFYFIHLADRSSCHAFTA